MTREGQLALLCLAGIAPPLATALLVRPSAHVTLSLAVATALALLAYRWTVHLIPRLAPRHERARLVGKDINKKGTPRGDVPIPEALGLAPGVVTLVALALIQLAHSARLAPRLLGAPPAALPDPWGDDFPAALASIAFMLMLGFVDDVLDLPWRVKLVMPVAASLPLLAAYSGGTTVALPKPLVAALALEQTYVDLGAFYYGYMALLVIFCTNAINILAGVNGLEAGQTFLVALAILTHNLLQLSRAPDAASDSAALLSAYIMLPLAATTLALLRYNWYPSAVFVGDTFTYFAGMAIAVAGILGHFSETLLIFLLPQLFNFVYSMPQLFGIVHCPRHRLPTFDAATGLLTATPNWNLLNLVLHVGGPCTEVALCTRLLGIQVLTCAAGVAAHFLLAGAWK